MVKMKSTLQIYIVPSVDWNQPWRIRLSSFGGEANTNCYPSEKKICVMDEPDMGSNANAFAFKCI